MLNGNTAQRCGRVAAMSGHGWPQHGVGFALLPLLLFDRIATMLGGATRRRLERAVLSRATGRVGIARKSGGRVRGRMHRMQACD